ncbi:MAG: homoserine dehydrogenase [Alphaproteobacteria bacterium 64-11]|nr:homoserine dehydrogenase [Alphaproteobacteria bacterium]OJU08900.1 MAG: homoserine dehydrogenase [Alphaproteobacteria bacterium 64-11]
MNKSPFRIAIAGLGTVGGGVVKALTARGEELSRRAGRELKLVSVSARDPRKARGYALTGWTADPLELARGEADVVVELIGGDEGIARDLVTLALKNGKHVVTANKALLARHGTELAELAESRGVTLKFEAAAAGGIPILKALREGLIAQPIEAVKGILNGTCNYILTEMESSGRSFAAVLKEAQARGYAEADPTLDVGGGDTAHKLALLSSLAFGTRPDLDSISVEGIEHITPDDIAYAREFGFRIKLLGVTRRVGEGIEQKVHPSMVRQRSPLANVDGAQNGVMVDAGAAGSFFFSGRGAGETPTASAVIADIVEAASETPSPVFGRPARSLTRLVPADAKAAVSPWYLRFEVLDVPGVLALIAGHLAEAGVSIESMIQRGRDPGEPVAIVMITHETAQANVERALKAIAASDKVRSRPCMIPMEAA